MGDRMSIVYRPPTAPSQSSTPRNDPEYVAYLERRIAVLESRSPQTGLLSPSFMTRAFAVLGHYIVAALVLEVVALLVFGVFAVVISMVSSSGR